MKKKQKKMKYIKEYMEDRLKIKPLGEVSFEGLQSHDQDETYGYSVLIDGIDIGLEIWWSDYAIWLEKKYEEIKQFMDRKAQIIWQKQNGKNKINI